MWQSGVQDQYSSPFTALITAVTSSGGTNYYDWDLQTSDGDGGYETPQANQGGAYNSSPDLNTAMEELNNTLLTIPEGGLRVRAWRQGLVNGSPVFTFQAPPQASGSGFTPTITVGDNADPTALTPGFATLFGCELSLPGDGGYYLLSAFANISPSNTVGNISLRVYVSTDGTFDFSLPWATFISGDVLNGYDSFGLPFNASPTLVGPITEGTSYYIYYDLEITTDGAVTMPANSYENTLIQAVRIA